MATNRFLLLLVIGFLNSTYSLRYQIINVGIISGEEGDSRENDMKFWRFGRTYNVLLEPIVADVNQWSSLDLTRAVCSLLQIGVHVLVSSPPPRLLPLLESYSSKFQLPLVTTSSSALDAEGTVFMKPSTSRSIADLILQYQWESFIFIYDKDDGARQLGEILDYTNNRISVDAFWRVLSAEEANLHLNRIPPSRTRVSVVLATEQKIVEDLMSRIPPGEFHFIVTEPVVEVENNPRMYVPSTVLITKLSISVNPKSSAYLDLENRWQTLLAHLNRGARTKTVPSSALYMNDVANVLEKAFRTLLTDYPSFNVSSLGVDCLGDKPGIQRGDYFNQVFSNIKNVDIGSGMTGNIRFSANGQRMGFTFNVKEITSSGAKKVGNWSPKTRLVMAREGPTKERITADPMKKVKIISILGNTYLRLKEGANRTGNERFEGYIKDLLDELAQSLKWDYEIDIAENDDVGELSLNGDWTGMIGKVTEQEADLAIGPIAMTADRVEVVDFSKPILTVGLTILVKKPDRLQYSFSGIGASGMLRVWSYDVWLILILCYLVVGGATYAVSRFTGDPERIRSLETKLSDKLSLCSSFWFVLGVLTFRGTGIYPKSVTFRLLSLVWGFFSLMVLLFYISCLTSQLLKVRNTSDTTIYPIKTSEYLKNFLDNGYPKVGVWKSETFYKLAEKGVFKEYKDRLDNEPTLVVDSYEEGLKRVRNSDGGFALIVDSAFGQYISGRQPCDTMITAGYITHEPYAMAFKKGSDLRELVDHELLNIISGGDLRRLYEKWWYHDSSCVDPYLNALPHIYSTSLTLNELAGVFYFLIISICIAVAVGVAEYFYQSKKLRVEE